MITTHLHIHFAGMHAKNVSVPQHFQHAQQKFEGSFTCALARSSVRLVSVAALRAHLITYRIHSAVKNVIPQIQFFPDNGRVQSLSEVCLSMLPAARTPKTKSMPDHFNIEGQASLNDLLPARFESRLPLFVSLRENNFHRGIVCRSGLFVASLAWVPKPGTPADNL